MRALSKWGSGRPHGPGTPERRSRRALLDPVPVGSGAYGPPWLLGTVTVTELVVTLPLPSFAS